MEPSQLSTLARRLGTSVEPIVAQVYFAPECHAAYAALGFAGSSRDVNGVAMPDGPAYFTSRGSVMGQVTGEVVAATFAVFNPDVVIPSVQFGWSITDALTIRVARDEGAAGQLRRLLGPAPVGVERARDLLARAVAPLRGEGRALFAGVRSLPVPDDALAAVWRYGDMLREYRGDSHTASWISAGVDATEIALLTELYWGLPLRTYSRTRAWTTDQFDAACERLVGRGWVEGDVLTEEGRAHREAIEVDTDRQMAPAINALGDDIDELFTIIEPWGATVREGFGYPASGPRGISNAASRASRT